MTECVVRAVPGSPYARSVMIALEEKGIPWTLAAMVPGELKREPYLSMQPFGRMSVFQHGDFTLYETQAILRYLERIAPSPALTPADPRVAARMDQLMGINDWYLFQNCATAIVFYRVVGPALMGTTPDLAAIANAMPRAHLVFEQISRMLGDNDFLVGPALTLADLMVGAQMEFFARAPEWHELTADRPNLVGWLKRIEARPSFRATVWEKLAERVAA